MQHKQALELAQMAVREKNLPDLHTSSARQ